MAYCVRGSGGTCEERGLRMSHNFICGPGLSHARRPLHGQRGATVDGLDVVHESVHPRISEGKDKARGIVEMQIDSRA